MDKKSSQLGMPFGTASYRLKKMLLFMLVQETHRNMCYHCNDVIANVEDFSIEHKIPWLDNSPELFWAFHNVAFSHKRCNYSNIRRDTDAVRAGHKKQREKVLFDTPEGEAWCCSCKKSLSSTEFHRNSSKWRGLNTECKSCVKRRKRLKVSKRVTNITFDEEAAI